MVLIQAPSLDTSSIEKTQIKAIAQYFHVVQFLLLYIVVQTFESVHESLKCDLSDGR